MAALDQTGNASSIHAEGRAVRATVEHARRQVAALVGADARAVVFTAGATEAANLVLRPQFSAGGRQPTRLLIAATEHPCVQAGHRFEAAEVVPVGPDGVVDLAALKRLVGKDGVPLVALQAANNETGVLQPVREAASIVHAAGGLLVCDAVQAAGRISLDLAQLGADALILSSHKIGGPKGAGAIVFASPDVQIAAPLIRGGGQERGFRAGTEDVPAIAGFGAACAEVLDRQSDEVLAARTLRDAFEAGVRRISSGALFLGGETPRLPNTSCFALPGAAGATLLMALDLAGVAVSAGSACSSGKSARSPVLDAMRIDAHIADCVLRVSFGWNSNPQDADRLLETLAMVMFRLARRDRAA